MASKNAKSYSSSNNADAVNNGSIPLIKSKDNAKQLPTYYNVLQRSSEDYLSAEDLDKIQAELETLLSNVALRYRVLKAEYESLDKDERRNERRSKHTTSGEKAPSSPAVQSSSGKRKRDTDTSTQLTRKPKSSVKHIKNAKKSPNPQQHTDDSTDSTPTVVQNTLTVPADINIKSRQIAEKRISGAAVATAPVLSAKTGNGFFIVLTCALGFSADLQI
ncbi:transcriptional adapter 3-like [Teleopsis dalmanni]|uniref:transcriptional adapter 3-like n=1 Tax=Teleopsis dalmanni TaxID=139649 RepID=UPI0018CD73B6|nr:transcriptional adapter 3-like [Teleopsis dalmanni]